MSPAGRTRAGLVLAASTFGFSMVLLDTTVVNVAAPAIRHDLHASGSTIQWVVSAYTLVFAALLLSTGSLADRIGARRVFLAGLATFGLGSAAAAAAPSAGALVAAQGILGLGAALVLPTSLALLTLAFPQPGARARAIGTWAAGSAAAFALGPVVGGALTDAAGWRWIFLINLPVALLATALAWRHAPRQRPQGAAATSAAGQAGAIVALGALTFGLIEGGDQGWSSTPVLAAFAVAAATATWLVAHERRTASPLVPGALLADRRFSASTAAGALVNLAFYGELFVLSLFLQQQRGLSALEAGLAFLPQPLLFMAVSGIAGRMAAANGPRLPLTIGGVLATLGAVALLSVDESSSYLLLAGGLVLNGLGGGLIIPSVTAGVMSSAPQRLAGIASASFNAGRQVGGAIGVALLGSLAAGGDPVGGLHAALVLAAVALAAATLLARAMPARAPLTAPAAA